jgi:hypothetical protein
MPQDFARFATSNPVAPRPMITSVFPCISEPKIRALSDISLLVSAESIFFAKYNMRKSVCSATEIALARGTFATNIDFDVQ